MQKEEEGGCRKGSRLNDTISGAKTENFSRSSTNTIIAAKVKFDEIVKTWKDYFRNILTVGKRNQSILYYTSKSYIEDIKFEEVEKLIKYRKRYRSPEIELLKNNGESLWYRVTNLNYMIGRQNCSMGVMQQIYKKKYVF